MSGDESGNDDLAPFVHIGEAIRVERLAAGRRQAWLAKRINVSTSALSRYESGAVRPDDAVLRAIDDVLVLGGTLVGLTSLDAQAGHGSTVHFHRVPAPWLGHVWVVVRSADRTALSAVAGPLRLRWGPWAREISTGDAGSQLVAMFRISRVRPDDDSPPIRLETPGVTVVRWGEGVPPPHLQPVDVSEGWYPAEAGDLLRAAGALLHDALAFVGRTPAELAAWLEVPLEHVESLLRGVPLSVEDPHRDPSTR